MVACTPIIAALGRLCRGFAISSKAVWSHSDCRVSLGFTGKVWEGGTDRGRRGIEGRRGKKAGKEGKEGEGWKGRKRRREGEGRKLSLMFGSFLQRDWTVSGVAGYFQSYWDMPSNNVEGSWA